MMHDQTRGLHSPNRAHLLALTAIAFAAVVPISSAVLLYPRLVPGLEPTYLVTEQLDTHPISLLEARRLIEDGDVVRLILQPPADANGGGRAYQFGDQEWRVAGVDVVVVAWHGPEQRRILGTKPGFIGVTEAELAALIDDVHSYNIVSTRKVSVIDDRSWWARGEPLPEEPTIVVP